MGDWEVEKKINLGDLLTMMGMLAAILVFVGSGWVFLHNQNIRQDQDIALVRANIENIQKERENNQRQVLYRFDRLEAMVIRLDNKLDDKADK